MKCPKCESINLEIIKAGPHNKLICSNCLAFVKFLSKKEGGNMNVIERTKHDGAVNALHQRINSLMYDLSTRNWESIKDLKVFVRLGDAISDAENILHQMRETFEALRELEPENR